MPHIEGEILIQRSPEEVFDFVADERNEPQYNPHLERVEKLGDEPIGLGTRFEAVFASRRRPASMTIEWTGFERPKRLESTTRMKSMDIVGGLRLDPVAGGTRMQWSWDIESHGALRLAGPLVGRMGRRQEEAIWSALKQRLEPAGTM